MHIVEPAMSASELAPVTALVLKSPFFCQRGALVIRRNNPNKDPFEVEPAKRESEYCGNCLGCETLPLR